MEMTDTVRATARTQLERLLLEVNALNLREMRLSAEFKEIREQRAELDAKVAAIVSNAEHTDLKPSDWRELLSGIRSQVSASVARHSLR